MRTITIELSDEIGATDFDARMRVAVALYNEDILLLSECAALVGITKRAFIEGAGQYGGLKMGPQSPEELQAEFNSIRRNENHHLGHDVSDSPRQS